MGRYRITQHRRMIPEAQAFCRHIVRLPVGNPLVSAAGANDDAGPLFAAGKLWILLMETAGEPGIPSAGFYFYLFTDHGFPSLRLKFSHCLNVSALFRFLHRPLSPLQPVCRPAAQPSRQNTDHSPRQHVRRIMDADIQPGKCDQRRQQKAG